MGILLADFLIENEKRQSDNRDKVLICTAVSSSMTSKIIDRAGDKFHFEQTLTGFKWIGNKASDLSKQGLQVVFGYEEALGYMFPDISLDKDGIAAASCFIFAVKSWALKGLSPYEKLIELYQEYGWHDSVNTYFTSQDPTVTKRLFDFIRASETFQELRLGDFVVSRWRDVTNGKSYGKWPFEFIDPGSQMLTFDVYASSSTGEALFTLRASGTEPKIKLYLEAAGPDSASAQRLSKGVFETIVRTWIQQARPQVNHNGQAVSSLGQVISVSI